MNDISGVQIAIIKNNGTERIQVEQDGFVVKSGLTRREAITLAVKLNLQHENRNTG